MTKRCNVCKKELPIELFNKHPSTADKRQNQCRPCRNAVQVEYRNNRGGIGKQFSYEKTKKGFLVRVYRNMLSRVNGVQKRAAYHNLDILCKKKFYELSFLDLEFNRIFNEWEKCGYSRKATPSIDRINSSIGYTIGNIRWLTHSENSRLGAINRHKK